MSVKSFLNGPLMLAGDDQIREPILFPDYLETHQGVDIKWSFGSYVIVKGEERGKCR